MNGSTLLDLESMATDNTVRHYTHKLKVSFHLGLRLERMVLVFFLVSFLGSGVSLSLT